jgi:hypothetical protein
MVEISFDSCDGKLRQAKTHVERFRDELRNFDRPPSHTITVEDDSNTSSYVFRIFGLKEPRPSWGYVIGDCLNNLRAALDHMVFQLSILGKGGSLTVKEGGRTGFPITPHGEKLSERGLGFVRPGEKTRILELQLEHAGDASIWGLGPYGTPKHNQAWIPIFLTLLDALNNIDKHRLVHPTWRSSSTWGKPIPRPSWVKQSSGHLNPLEDGAEIESWSYDGVNPKPDPPADVEMDRYFPIGVALGDPPVAPYPANELLARLARTVEIVLDIFRPCITGGAAIPLSALTASPIE